MKVPDAAALKQAGILESFFHTGEVKIHYAAGPASGDPIVFIPGQGCTWEEDGDPRRWWLLRIRYRRGGDGRLLRAVDDEDIAKVKSLIGGTFDYLCVDSRHATPLDIPEREAKEIRAFKTRHDF